MQVKIFALLLGGLLLALNPAASPAQLQSPPKLRVGTPPYDILAAILTTNQQQRPDQTGNSQAGPPASPLLTWLADSSPGLRSGAILQPYQGSIFAVRNLGPEMLPVIDSVDHGVLALHTPLLLITGVIPPAETAAERASEELQPDESEADDRETGKTAPIVGARHRLEQRIDELVDLALGRYRERIAKGRLLVVGSLLDQADSYGAGRGSLVIININGEKETMQLLRHQAASKLDKGLRRLLGRAPRP